MGFLSSWIEQAGPLLEAIAADPEGEGPRLVLADWFLDRGERPRAELIRAQLALARLDPWDPAAVLPRATAQRIMRFPGDSWLRKIKLPHDTHWYAPGFRRGLPAEVRVTRFAALAALPEVGLPIEHVVTPLPESPRDLPEAPPALRELTVVTPSATPSGSTSLAEWPGLRGVHTLSLALPDPVASLRTLLESPHLTGLTTLRLPSAALSRPGFEEVVSSSAWPTLRTLEVAPLRESWLLASPEVAVSAAELREQRTRAESALGLVLRGARARTLRGLTLSDLSCRSLPRFPADVAPTGLSLQRLNLSTSPLDPLVAESLSRCPGLARLRQLELASASFDAVAARALADAPWFAGLQVLDLTASDDPTPLISAIAEGATPSLHTLLLDRAFVRTRGGAWEALLELLKGPAADSLRVLDLSGNSLADPLAEALVTSSHLRGLQVLRASRNWFSVGARAKMRSSPLAAQLHELDVG